MKFTTHEKEIIRKIAEGRVYNIVSYLTFVMEITDVADDGTLKAIFDYPHENRSCTASGYFDAATLLISFDFKEWIEAPARNKSIYEPYLYGYLSISDNTLTGITDFDKNEFQVEKTE